MNAFYISLPNPNCYLNFLESGTLYECSWIETTVLFYLLFLRNDCKIIWILNFWLFLSTRVTDTESSLFWLKQFPSRGLNEKKIVFKKNISLAHTHTHTHGSCLEVFMTLFWSQKRKKMFQDVKQEKILKICNHQHNTWTKLLKFFAPKLGKIL